MNHEQQVRYARNISLKEIGADGQTKLLNSQILVVGAGGLACPAIAYLVSSGVGTIGVCDDDVVSLSNLQRQILFETNDIGTTKIKGIKEFAYDLNPEVKIIDYNLRIEADNIDDVIAEYDIVIDTTDNIQSRLLINDKCHQHRKTLISGAIHGFNGQISVFKSYLGSPHPCYRCLYPNITNATKTPNCANSGVSGSIAGIIGSMQANCAINELLKIGKSLSGTLITINLLKNDFKNIKLKKNKGCNCCDSY